MNDGHAVVGVDGLKIEPLTPARLRRRRARRARAVPADPRLRGARTSGSTSASWPGFGGVAEYGITVRWDKNFLKLIRLLLERRAEFAMFGGVRFGGTLDHRQRLRAGLRPYRAVRRRRPADRRADDERARARRAQGVGFPDGAAADRRGEDRQSIANLRCACRSWSSAAASPRSTRRRNRWPIIRCRSRNSSRATKRSSPSAARRRCAPAGREEEREIADEFIAHARAIRAERAAAAREGRAPRIVELLDALGRRHHRLSPAPDRRAELYAEPRGGGQGDGGGHPLRRRPVAARRSRSIASATPRR